MISIHVPRTGDDDRRKAHCPRNQYFNPRPPHGGTTEEYDKAFDKAMISIHVPRTGDDKSRGVAFTDNLIISIHIPRTGDDVVSGMRLRTGHISIHVPRTGDDKYTQAIEQKSNISIHVPRMGDDGLINSINALTVDFNPRPPCGGRRRAEINAETARQFQSTSPVRGTTVD